MVSYLVGRNYIFDYLFAIYLNLSSDVQVNFSVDNLDISRYKSKHIWTSFGTFRFNAY